MSSEEKSTRIWTEDEVLLALYLYFQLPFGQLDARNPEVKKLAEAIGRTSGSVAMKLGNLASLDPKIVESGRKGLSKASKLDREVYARFGRDWDGLVEVARAKWHSLVDRASGASFGNGVQDAREAYSFEPYSGSSTVETVIQQRVGQGFFRRAVLANFNECCCVSGIAEPKVLVASHIRPWGIDGANRHNPANGLLLSGTLDRAFDAGLISVNGKMRVAVAEALLSNVNQETREYFSLFHGISLRPAVRFDPDPAFLDWHFRERFVDNRPKA